MQTKRVPQQIESTPQRNRRERRNARHAARLDCHRELYAAKQSGYPTALESESWLQRFARWLGRRG